jgi:hypothetical protein
MYIEVEKPDAVMVRLQCLAGDVLLSFAGSAIGRSVEQEPQGHNQHAHCHHHGCHVCQLMIPTLGGRIRIVLFRQFGPKPLGVKGVAKQISKLLEHANADVRNQTKAMAVEIYRWIGDVLKPQLQNLKPIQVR